MESSATIANRFTLPKLELNSFKAWLICLSAALFFFYDFMQMMMCNSLSEVLIKDFGIEAKGLGILASSFLLSDVLFLFPAGLIIDRVSTRKVTLMMLSLSILGALGLALTSSFKMACFFRFVAGIAHAFCFLCCVSLATKWFSPNRQAFVIGLIVTIAMCGGLVAQTPLALLSDYLGWRNALLANVGFGVVVLALIYSIVQDNPVETSNDYQRYRENLANMGFWKSLSRTISNRQNWLLGMYTGLMNLPIMVMGGLLAVLYLTKVFSISKTDATFVSSMIFLGTIFGAPICGKISDVLEKRRLPMVVGCIVSIFVLLAIMYGENWSLNTLMVLFFLLGFFTSTQVISYPAINESNPQSISSTAMGFAAVMIMGLGGSMQYLSGVLLDMSWDGGMLGEMPLYTKENFLFAMSMLPVGLILSLIITALVKETNCKAINE
ncbi:MAG: MFS transporter [Legionellales bacterium]|nr:MFS transporter [Legionellales bacterium]